MTRSLSVQLLLFIRHRRPVAILLMGYLSYSLIGWLLLSLPVTWQDAPVSALDSLFIAVSAVSTTGLVSVSPSDSYNRLGEFVIIALIQLGGIGYMTIGSFAVLASQQRFSRFRERMVRTVFALPEGFDGRQFIKHVVIFTLLIEALGALALYYIFLDAGMAEPLWSAIFHSISAFCTAGFSLYNNSFEGFRDNFWLNIVICTLSYLGAIGFIVMADFWRGLTRDPHQPSLTSRIILHSTFWIALIGAVTLFVVEPGIAQLPPSERALAAGFQTMTAMTTVGFNTYPIGALMPAALLLVVIMMVIGASPSGTGGGLKTTTVATVYATVNASMRGRQTVTFWNQRVPDSRLLMAFAAVGFYLMVLMIGSFILLLLESHPFEDVLFEAASALGTVGLSRGITGDLTPMGQVIITLMMFMGRVGPLTFAVALFPRPVDKDQTPAEAEEDDIAI